MKHRFDILAAAAIAAVACAAPAPQPGKVQVALNWKPEPEFGGLWEATRGGAFARHGLEVETTGGPGAPVVQMVEAGQVAYGIASADEVAIARSRGADVVAVFATYQRSPQGLMAHAERGLTSLDQAFAGGTLAVEPGLPYVQFLKRRYDLTAMAVVPYTYSIAPFLADPTMVQQVFVTAEPISARRQGVESTVFLIGDSGFDPYTAVYVTRGAHLAEDRDGVAAFVAGLREGWRAYLADPAPANAVMGGLNPEMDAETFGLAAVAQAPLVATTTPEALGTMTLERWTTLVGQLRELGLIGEVDPAACFENL